MKERLLVVKGASLHNLKNINVAIPRDKLTVLTGVSGSGKSTLAFDTIFAEGQRRYVESLSSYVRQFLSLMQKPPVEVITGLSPAISIQQKGTSHNPRSTVGTITEIHDFFRVLFARVGRVHCPMCGNPINQKSVDQVGEEIMQDFKAGEKIIILSPLVRSRKGSFEKLFEQFKKRGFSRVRIDGEIYRIEERPALARNKRHDIQLVVDRIILKESVRSRMREAIELAMELSNGTVIIFYPEADSSPEKVFSRILSCISCHSSLPELSPRLFSFNSPIGACPKCEGLGYTSQFDENLICENNLSIAEGAITVPGVRNTGYFASTYEALAKKYNFSLKTPLKDLEKSKLDKIFYGTGKDILHVNYKMENHTFSTEKPFPGLLALLKRRFLETDSDAMKTRYSSFMLHANCEECGGARLSRGALNVFLQEFNIDSLSELSVLDCLNFFKSLKFTGEKEIIASGLVKEILNRLNFLNEVGLSYLTLKRRADTLSGGELQRIRLATQIGSGLVGVLYILDEPSIGLHCRDNARLLKSLLRLRDLGNTLLVVEHDEGIIKTADHLIDMGPGAGLSGGNIVFAGNFAGLQRTRQSITGKFLSGREQIPVPASRRYLGPNWLRLKGLSTNNLKNIDIDLPLAAFVCVTGVSGSGKSSLVKDTLWPLLARKLNRSKTTGVGQFKSISGLDNLDKAIEVDQSPIGRTPRSNPATYTKVFDEIRVLFSKTKEALVKGYKPGRFSFNVSGGRCENCQGDGVKKIEMHLLPDVFVECEVCHGKRFNTDTLQINFKGYNIADVLNLTVLEALSVFQNVPKIRQKLSTLNQVGLGYIKLGQSSLTLSGGEAQRVKLATELSKRNTGKTFYILDEPTTGLHFLDIRHLLKVLHNLVDKGNSVLVVEHNMEVIKTADYIVDLGPEGGHGGGFLVCSGTPEKITGDHSSYTGQYLKQVIK
ncbi:excinuclease ABC subunit UvrA [Candidatus Riflebacteria bacterium]